MSTPLTMTSVYFTLRHSCLTLQKVNDRLRNYLIGIPSLSASLLITRRMKVQLQVNLFGQCRTEI